MHQNSKVLLRYTTRWGANRLRDGTVGVGLNRDHVVAVCVSVCVGGLRMFKPALHPQHPVQATLA